MIIFDLESNGLLKDVTEIHCIVLHDTDTEETTVYNDQSFEGHTNKSATEPVVRAIQILEDAPTIAGHNIINYDLAVINKLYPWFRRIGDCLDTLLLSRLYHPDMMALDKRNNWKHMPLKLYGSHSLESYGYRLGEYKGEYGKTSDWKEWSEDMQDYCIQDVKVTTKLCNHFRPYLSGSK